MYSTETETTRQFCTFFEYDQSVGFVETFKRGKTLYVRGTVGKRYEFDRLRGKVEEWAPAFKRQTGLSVVYSPRG